MQIEYSTDWIFRPEIFERGQDVKPECPEVRIEMTNTLVNFLEERRRRRPGNPLGEGIATAGPPVAPMPESLPITPSPATEAQKQETGPQCWSCTTTQAPVYIDLKPMIICNGCIALCNEILADEGISTDAKPDPEKVKRVLANSKRTPDRCSGCGRLHHIQIARLIALPHNLYLCNECVGACNLRLEPILTKDSAETTDTPTI